MLSTVLSELNFVKQVTIQSDRCSQKDIEKLEHDFEKELTQGKKFSRISLNKYLKNTGVKEQPVADLALDEDQQADQSASAQDE